MGRVAEHLLGDRIDTLHVHDRIHHHDVGRANILADLARGDRRDHDLGDTDRQAPHAGGRERSAARSARRNDAPDVSLAGDPARERVRHGAAPAPRAASWAPPPPPAEMMPPMSRSRSIQRANASAMAPTACPRSPEKTAFDPPGCMEATCNGDTSAREILPDVERSTVRTWMPTSRSRSPM